MGGDASAGAHGAVCLGESSSDPAHPRAPLAPRPGRRGAGALESSWVGGGGEPARRGEGAYRVTRKMPQRPSETLKLGWSR